MVRILEILDLNPKTLKCRVAAEMAEACGTAYYRYGAALLYRAQEEQDVFGDDMKSAAQQRDVQVRGVLCCAAATCGVRCTAPMCGRVLQRSEGLDSEMRGFSS